MKRLLTVLFMIAAVGIALLATVPNRVRVLAQNRMNYSIVGQKDIDFWHPLKTFTTLPADIVDADHHRVGTCLTRFDLRRDWWRFLRSFRPA